ncbi:glycosyltransferase [Ideonella sp.]|uniref:glycosyltransferase n=1 Tax=Ideonella sp. TaxID=1929293 RepID=UPI0035ADD2F5
MKVLHVEAGKHLYGGALQVVFLMRGLAARGVPVALACPAGSAIAAAVRELGLPVHEMPMHGDADIGLVGRLGRLIRQERPDLLHLHSRRGCDTWGAVAGRLQRVPVVLSRRVDNPESRAWAALKYRLPDHVVTISQGIRQVLLAEGLPAARITCVPSAVDTQQYRPDRAALADFRAEYGLAPDEPVIGMAAQFIERKGHATLLDAMPAVLARHPRTRVLLFGQGPLVEPVRARIESDERLRGRVQLAGFRRDLDRLLPCLDLLAHPAHMEGLGVALLQAAACGVPIVGGRAGGIPEIVRPGLNGELVEPGDAPGLAAALTGLLDDPARRARYGTAGRAWVERHFSIDAMVEGNLAVYRRLLEARR